MKMRAMIAGAVWALATATVWAQSTNPSVDPALQATVAKFAQVFDSADPKAFATFFTKDATIMNPMGAVAHGPAEIEKLFGQDGVRTFKGSRSAMTITGTRQVGPDAMWVDVDHVVQNAHRPDGTVGTLKPHMAILAQKQGGDWKWAEVRAWLPMPRDAAHGPRPK